MQAFYPVTNAPKLDFLAVDIFTPGPSVAPDEVRGDALVDFSIAPLSENTPGSTAVYDSDFDPSDTFSMGIGNFDTPPTGGTVSLTANGSASGLTSLAYNITAAALQTALNAAITAGGGGSATALCTVTLVQAGTYLLVGSTNQAVASGFFATTSAALLTPLSTASFYEDTLGSASTPYRILFVMVQQAMCYAEPTAPLADPDASLSTVQAGSATANKIQNITYTPGANGGSIVISATADSVVETCGTLTPGMSVLEIGNVLNNHSEIEYNNPDGTANNIVITPLAYGNFNVEFTGTLGNNNANALSIISSSVNGPKGLSGQINYNTIALYLYSLTQTGDTFNLKRQIQRTRSTGEIRTIYISTVTIWKNVLNIATAVPTPIPSYFTTTQSDARYLRRDANSALTGAFTTEWVSSSTLQISNGATFAIFGQSVTAKTGTGNLVLATSPRFTTDASPSTNDAAALGTTALQWSDLFLAAGAVVNWANGALTLTQSGATLTVAGGEIILAALGPTSTLSSGYLGWPQNSKSADYTLLISDAAKQILHPVGDNNARTFTINSNANVAYPIGTQLLFINEINTVTIAITTDTLVLAGAGTTGSRTLAAMGMALAVKKTSTSWMITNLGGLT